MKINKGEVIALEKMFDETVCVFFWRAIISFQEIPDLELGLCEVKQ